MDRVTHSLCRVLRCLTLGALLLGSGAADAGPVPIAIINPSFEANPVSPGCFAVFGPLGWQAFDPGGILDGSLDVLGGLHPQGGPYYVAPPPDGQHVAIVFLSGDTGATPAGLLQVLGATLEPNQRYTLSVGVGNIASGTGPPPCDVFGFFNLDGFPGYQVQLLAGGVIIAQDDNTLDGQLGEGEFGASIVELDVDADHPQIGQALEIRLINLNLPGSIAEPGIEVNFDDVQLTATAIASKCSADLTGDGVLDFFDVQSFLAAFAASNEAADFNGDALFDFFDVQLFLQVFAAGCP